MYTILTATCRKYCNFKMIYYQVNYNCSGIPPYFPATCLEYSNFIPLQLDRKSFLSYIISGKLLEILVLGYPLYTPYQLDVINIKPLPLLIIVSPIKYS